MGPQRRTLPAMPGRGAGAAAAATALPAAARAETAPHPLDAIAAALDGVAPGGYEAESALLGAVAAALLALVLVRLRWRSRQARAHHDRIALLRNALEMMDQGAFAFDASGRLACWNRSAFAAFDLPERFARTGTALADVLAFQAARGDFGPQRRDGPDACARWAAAAERGQTLRLDLPARDGALELRWHALPDGGAFTFYRDVSEDWRRERRLVESEARLNELAGTGTEFLWETGPDLRLVYLSAQAAVAIGVDPAALVGAQLSDLPFAAGESGREALSADLLARRAFADRRIRLAHSGRGTRTLDLGGRPRFDAHGAFLGFRGTGVDVTERLAADARLVGAIDHLQLGFALFDGDDRLVVNNATFARMFACLGPALAPGISYETLLRAAAAARHLDLGGAPLDRFVAKRMALHRHPQGPVEQRLANGRAEEVREQVHADGSTTVIVTDVTHAARRERDLAEKSELLQRTLDSIGEGLAVFDGDLRLVAWNDRMADLLRVPDALCRLGLDFEEVVADLATRQRVGGTARLLRAVSSSLIPEPATLTLIWADGRQVETRTNPMPGGGFVVVFSDTTERERALAALRRSEQNLALHAERTPLGAVEWDLSFRAVSWNRAAERIFGLAREDALGRTAWDLLVGESDRARIEAAWDDLLAGQGGERWQLTGADTAGRAITCEWINTRLIDADGRTIGVASLIQDVTARAAAESALRSAKDAAENGSRAKSAFLADVSHELRTPLNSIAGFAEMIGEAMLGPVGNPKYREYARDIRASALHVLDIANDLLDAARIEAGVVALAEEETDLTEIAAESCRLVGALAARARVELSLADGSELPLLRADRRAVKQALVNLLSNAIKASPPGGAVRIAAALDADGGLALSVADAGPGIAAERIPSLFQRFGGASGQGPTASPRSGIGLGLPLSKALIELHGGVLAVASESGRGSVFTLHFPARRSVPQDAAMRRRA